MRSFLWALATLVAAGCVNLAGTADTRTEPAPEPDYRNIVAAAVKGNLTNPASFAPLEISAIKRSAAIFGDWAVCVKGLREGQPAYFTVFIKEHRVEKWREAVIVDRCPAEQYEPLQSPPEAPTTEKKVPPKRRS
jgi:hypothetical protein